MKKIVILFSMLVLLVSCCKDNDPPDVEIGDTYEGGIVCDIQPDYILVAAPTDQSEGMKWDNGTVVVTDAKSRDDGYLNTNKIIDIQGTGTYAATICTALGDGWYLPSELEMDKIFSELTLTGIYWTSTEYSDVRAKYSFHFDPSFVDASYKSVLNKVRAAKRIYF